MPDLNDLVDEYLDQEKIHRFEGDKGVKNLNKVAFAIGYSETPFKYGSSLEQFLSDNAAHVRRHGMPKRIPALKTCGKSYWQTETTQKPWKNFWKKSAVGWYYRLVQKSKEIP